MPQNRDKIVIYKQRRLLMLYVAGKIALRCPVSLGTNPTGRKERQGDRRTPEGTYFVTLKNARSRFHLSLGISYPNADDARNGLQARRISETQYRQIMDAARGGRIPPQNTPLGGDIMIHGGNSVPYVAGQDWTWGCVALQNGEIETLFASVRVGTPVYIFR